MAKLYCRLPEISELYSIKVRTLRAWIYSGKLKASKPGRHYMVAVAEMKRVLEQNEFEPFRVRSFR
jgi:excisionase family DNA binding protein